MLPFDLSSEAAKPQGTNGLRRYLYQQSPEDLAKIAQTVSTDVQQMVSMNVQGLLGGLPSEHFGVEITTNRDNLAGLLASAMMTGYFLRRVEQRMELERQFAPSVPVETEEDPTT
ncbi:DUF760 domain-containing protein [Candidatus Cyanaurora vandensis]|uniref:DUF760 domain-containing protein n=1 Tax=Candidatus Cyanaurora vandensis TaxID=2714958 RepID=UPI00257FB7B7|nr:DUF760 domain-containing protein [Candidatus Cyanaurora vandensis]